MSLLRCAPAAIDRRRIGRMMDYGRNKDLEIPNRSRVIPARKPAQRQGHTWNCGIEASEPTSHIRYQARKVEPMPPRRRPRPGWFGEPESQNDALASPSGTKRLAGTHIRDSSRRTNKNYRRGTGRTRDRPVPTPLFLAHARKKNGASLRKRLLLWLPPRRVKPGYRYVLRRLLVSETRRLGA